MAEQAAREAKWPDENGRKKENSHRCFPEHTGCTSPCKPNRQASDHHGAVPAPPRSKRPRFQPWSQQLCNPWGSKTPKKQTPPCTPDPGPGPCEQLPSPPATPRAALGIIRRQQAATEPQGHQRCHRHGRVLSSSCRQQRDGEHRDALPPQHCGSWGTQTCILGAERCCCPIKQRSPALTRAPASLPMPSPVTPRLLAESSSSII